MTMYDMSDTQYQTVYNVLSFSLACMMATTLFLWMRVPAINEKYKSALMISGMVTFIAAYHYLRIFNSWTSAYSYPTNTAANPGGYEMPSPVLTGEPFNDAYRYMDWLLTVPLLLMEIVLVMKVDPKDVFMKCLTLGGSSALMIILGYPGELKMKQDELSGRWVYWALAMVPFCYIVYTLLIGLRSATEAERDDDIKSKIKLAQWVTVVSWLTYPIVYIIPMMGATGAQAVVGVQIGYCISDIISKCGVGLIIYQVTLAKSAKVQGEQLIAGACA